jgi:Tol biopolymer transport system component
MERGPTSAAGRVAFTSATPNGRIWLHPLSADGRRLAGPPRALTAPELTAFDPALSPDGTRLAVQVDRSGSIEGHRHDLLDIRLSDGRVRTLRVSAIERAAIYSHQWAPDSRRIAYRYLEVLPDGSWQNSARVLDVDTGTETQVTSAARRTGRQGIENVYGWSPDGRFLVTTGTRYTPGRFAIALVPVASAPQAEEHARVVQPSIDHDVWAARMSPDTRWFCFLSSPSGAATSALYVVPAGGGVAVPLTDGVDWDDKPRWSDDGTVLYFLSNRGGIPNVWTLPFDSDRGRPAGPPQRLTNFSYVMPVDNHYVAWEISVAGRHLAVPMADDASSIWMID